MAQLPLVTLDGAGDHTYTVNFSDVRAESAEALRAWVLDAAEQTYPEKAARYRIMPGYSLEPAGLGDGSVRVRSITVEVAVATTEAEKYTQ